eukprot:1769210-Prymnesium_polylepis.1
MSTIPSLTARSTAILSQWSRRSATRRTKLIQRSCRWKDRLSMSCYVCGERHMAPVVQSSPLTCPCVYAYSSQCESQAKQQKLYSRRDPCWIEFEDAQKARVKAEAAYKAMAGGAKKLLALRD